MTTLKEFLKTDRFATCTGVELLEIKPGYARARMEVTDRHLNGGFPWSFNAAFTPAMKPWAAVLFQRQKKWHRDIVFRIQSESRTFAPSSDTFTE